MTEVPSLLGRFVGRPFLPLGPNGFGRSDTRQALRRFFELNSRWVVSTAFYGLHQAGAVDAARVKEVLEDQGIDPAKPDPFAH